ncbi:MAG: hypothetical protein RLZZ301_1102 [Bacteroidota bacterium]|jgi:hypothetical protein
MQPLITLNPWSILAATLASFVFGFIWYSFIVSKAWQKEMHAENMEYSTKKMVLSLVLNFVGTLLMAFVLTHNIQAWDARTWGHGSNFVSPVYAAWMGAFFTWLGFYVPQDFNKVAFQNRTWKLFFMDTTYNLLSLMIASFVLVFCNC